MTVVGLFRNAQKTLTVPAGDVVFRDGEAGDEMYGIVESEIELHSTRRVIATLGADDVFG